MPPLGSTDDLPTNPTPVLVTKDPVPVGGYVTRPVAGRKRFDDNDDVLNFKYPRLSENASHPPPLRLSWNDEPDLGSGSQIPPPHVPSTREHGSRVVKSIPRAFNRGGQGKDAIKEVSIGQTTLSNPAPKSLVKPADKVPSARGAYPQPPEHLMQGPQPQPQHHQLLQGLLQQPSHYQHQQRPPSLPPDRPVEEVPPPRHNQHQLRPSPPPPLSPSRSEHESPPWDVPLPVFHQQQPQPQLYHHATHLRPHQHQHQHQHHLQHQIQSFPLPSPSPYGRQLPPPVDVPQQYQSQLNPSQHWSQRQVQNPVQGPSGIHSVPEVGADGLRVVPSRDERTQGENQVAYEALLIQLIQNVYHQSTGRMLTQQEAVESWNQLDDQQKSTFHGNVCAALAQVRGQPPAEPTSRPVNVVADAPSQIRPAPRGNEHFVARQGSELGFGFEEMEEHASPVPNAMDLDEEMTTQESNSTIRHAQQGEEDVAMRNAGKSRDVGEEDEEDEEDEEEEFPSGVDGFGFPVNDTEHNEASMNQARNADGAVATRPDAGLRTDRTSDPLLLVLLGKFGTLVDAINRQTDAIQSMDTVLRNYVEESRKNLEAGIGNAAEVSNATNDGAAAQNVVAPGIARKIQERVAQITGQAVERSSGDTDKASLKLLKERVRSHLLTLLGVPCLDLLATRCRPLTEEEIASYLADDGSVECSPHNFRIDFQREWKRFSFNKEAREVFIENFIDVMMGSGMKEDQTIPEHLLHHDTVGQILDSYVTGTLRRKYKELLQLAPGPRDGEDNEDAQQHVQAAQKRHEEALRKAGRVSRKTTTFVARNVIIAVTPSLQRHSVLFARLTASNMSEDESDGPRKAVPRKFRIIIAEWQSNELRELLWELDRQYRANWENTPKARRRPGNTPRERKLKSDSRSEPGVAAQGLWRNCYNPEWASKLNRYDRKSLQIIDSDYDFSQPPQDAPQIPSRSEADPST